MDAFFRNRQSCDVKEAKEDKPLSPMGFTLFAFHAFTASYSFTPIPGRKIDSARPIAGFIFRPRGADSDSFYFLFSAWYSFSFIFILK
jgi:hypothetical protein